MACTEDKFCKRSRFIKVSDLKIHLLKMTPFNGCMHLYRLFNVSVSIFSAIYLFKLCIEKWCMMSGYRDLTIFLIALELFLLLMLGLETALKLMAGSDTARTKLYLHLFWTPWQILDCLLLLTGALSFLLSDTKLGQPLMISSIICRCLKLISSMKSTRKILVMGCHSISAIKPVFIVHIVMWALLSLTGNSLFKSLETSNKTTIAPSKFYYRDVPFFDFCNPLSSAVTILLSFTPVGWQSLTSLTDSNDIFISVAFVPFLILLWLVNSLVSLWTLCYFVSEFCKQLKKNRSKSITPRVPIVIPRLLLDDSNTRILFPCLVNIVNFLILTLPLSNYLSFADSLICKKNSCLFHFKLKIYFA